MEWKFLMPKPKSNSDAKLWKAYLADPNDLNRNAILQFHWKFISKITFLYLKNRHLTRFYEDALSRVGERILKSAIPGYERKRSAVRTYFTFHIHGAIGDFLRDADDRSRRRRQTSNQVDAAREYLGHKFGRSPNQFEIAEHLGIDESAVVQGDTPSDIQANWKENRLLFNQNAHRHEMHFASPPTEELDVVDTSKFDILTKGLSETNREMLRMYYYENRTMREIGEHFGRSEGRVSQRLAQIKDFLKHNRKKEEFFDDI
jgi:RNA polymerase sigma factor for flagellar operon FliA